MSEEQKNSWGGVRSCSGRKKKPHMLFIIRIPKELGDVIESQPNKSKFIKDAINNYLTLSKLGQVIIVSMICVLRGNVGLFRYMHRLVKKREVTIVLIDTSVKL